jgi:NAD(P)H-dependent FMN reductase
MTSKILFLSGSARRNSSNKKLAKAAYNIALEKKNKRNIHRLKRLPNADLRW